MDRPIFSKKFASLNQAAIRRASGEECDLVAEGLEANIAIVVRDKSGNASLISVDADGGLDSLDLEVARMQGDYSIDIVTCKTNLVKGGGFAWRVYEKYPEALNYKGTKEVRKLNEGKPNLLVPPHGEGDLKQLASSEIVDMKAKSKVRQVVLSGDAHCNPEDVVSRRILLNKMLQDRDPAEPLAVLIEGLESSQKFIGDLDKMFGYVSEYSDKVKTKKDFCDQILKIESYLKRVFLVRSASIKRMQK